MTRGRGKHKSCECICHEVWGGSAHPKNRCRCNGGEGFDDFSVMVLEHENTPEDVQRRVDMILEASDGQG